MLASIVASKTAKLIATCVCPVVGAATLTMAVPKVRNAVHNATAPREYALPKTRERPMGAAAEPIALADPCIDVGNPGNLARGFDASPPIAVSDLPPVFGPDTGEPSPPGIFRGSPPDGPGGGGGGGGGGATVPEPHAWLQMLIGFMLIGGSVRLAARSEAAPEDPELFARLEDLKADSLSDSKRG